jgi:MYXO-CTERM domain-containing protein
MGAKTVAAVGAWVLLMSLSSHAGAQECPTSDIGGDCDAGVAGTCIAATCVETMDGSSVTRACAACVSLPDGFCEDAGDPCGEGGVCGSFGGGGGGGAGDGTYSISYSYAVCGPAFVGTESDAAGRPVSVDVDAATKEGAGASSGASSSGASSSGGGAAPHSGDPSSSGCAVAVAGHQPSGPGAFFCAALLPLALRRRRVSREKA